MIDKIPTGGVKDMLRSADGRKQLARLQKKHELDILQPSDPRFAKVYGATLRRNEAIHQKQVAQSQAVKEELAARREFDHKKNNPAI